MSITTKQAQTVANEWASEDQEPDLTDEERRRRQIERNRAAIALLDSWAEADEAEVQEQIETWEFLKRALDEDRPSSRKLFS